MKKISIAILVLVAAFVSCKKTPEVNLKYVDIERDLVTVGTTTANIQCDYDYITTLKKAYLYYGEGEDETDMTSAEMRVVQKTLYVELTGLKENTIYSYYYEFVNGFNSMRSSLKTFKTESIPTSVTLPTVVTATVTAITTNSAQCGGEVTNDGGAEVTGRGICWSTSANPTVSGSHIASGTGIGVFAALMEGLEANTTYHVRAYAINEAGTAYGLDKEFKTLTGGGSGCDYDYVDLGLPSGTLWATCNVGANSPEEYGDYFAWGETAPKDYYDFDTYKYCNGSVRTLTKYCTVPEYGYDGFTDDLTTLLPEDDAAAINWCSDWRMPSVGEWNELINYTTQIWTIQNGVNGLLFISSNGSSLFLPAAGIRRFDSLDHAGSWCRYWSSSLYIESPNLAWASDFSSAFNQHGVYDRSRRYGRPVRPVLCGTTPTPGGTPVVVTNEVTGITAHSASCCGEVIYDGGADVTERGICWSTNVNPTISDSHVSAGNGTGTFYAMISGLSANTTYHVRAYAINEAGTAYGLDKEFKTLTGGGGGGGNQWVDLGLPSGTLWATCNVGAFSPEEYGDYFAWGEIEPKENYDWSTYRYCNGDINQLTKYCNNPSYGFNGFTDNLIVLEPMDDAAAACWGNGWYMPTYDQWMELLGSTTCVWVTQNGVNGRLLTASNGNSLFLPAAGAHFGFGFVGEGMYGYYWASSLDTPDPDYAVIFGFASGSYEVNGCSREAGLTVRPVRSLRQN